MPTITLYGPLDDGGPRTKIREIQFLRAAHRSVHPTGPSLGLRDAKAAVDDWKAGEPRLLPVLAGTEDVIRLAAKYANIETRPPECRAPTFLFDGDDPADIPF
jgi:hypothetical protein